MNNEETEKNEETGETEPVALAEAILGYVTEDE